MLNKQTISENLRSNEQIAVLKRQGLPGSARCPVWHMVDFGSLLFCRFEVLHIRVKGLDLVDLLAMLKNEHLHLMEIRLGG